MLVRCLEKVGDTLPKSVKAYPLLRHVQATALGSFAKRGERLDEKRCPQTAQRYSLGGGGER